jgi:hypothetical protein
MFRHEDEGHEPNTLCLAGLVNAACQSSLSLVVSEQRHPSVAGERQLVQVARLMVVFDRFPMRPSSEHSQPA